MLQFSGLTPGIAAGNDDTVVSHAADWLIVGSKLVETQGLLISSHLKNESVNHPALRLQLLAKNGFLAWLWLHSIPCVRN